MFLVLFLIFIGLPIAELYVIIQVGGAIGVLPTIALLILDSIIGTVLWRTQGRATWRRFNEALAAGRPPAREVVDGALVIFGGAMLVTPGFITDIFGVLFLLPPTRALIRRLLFRNMRSRLFVGFASRAPGAREDYDVEGTARELHPRGRLGR